MQEFGSAAVASPPKQNRRGLQHVPDVAIAATVEDRLAAARLVGKLYRKEGYLPDDGGSEAPFLSPHHLRPETTVFVARENNRIVGTLTAVMDSPEGLPLDAIYPKEVAALRARQRVPCELCSLAVDTERADRSLHLVYGLFRCATVYLLHFTAMTDVLITLKPAHEAFYHRLMFQVLGQPTLDARFRNAPTVAMSLQREDALLAALEHRMAMVFGVPSHEELAAVALPPKRRGRAAPSLLGGRRHAMRR
ncbi:MAG: hypothetical protein HY291_09005 [Planctomycetes bacterium]|nr:hypothetical protein [Planctomycetota bacterium]